MGSRKMKLVTVGLALASVAQALDCINDPVELSGELLANWCDANASKCTDFDVDPCYDRNAEDVLEPRSTTMDDAQETEDASHDMSNKIRPKAVLNSAQKLKCLELGLTMLRNIAERIKKHVDIIGVSKSLVNS